MFGKILRAILPAFVLFSVAPASAGSPPDAAPIATEWRNPSNSVHIRIDPCGSTTLCGTVTWASDKAKADAARGGTTNLVGTRIFRDLRPAGSAKWTGKVFVPDIRQTFSGTLEFQDGNKMVGKGCVLFGIICKSQTWSRVR